MNGFHFQAYYTTTAALEIQIKHFIHTKAQHDPLPFLHCLYEAQVPLFCKLVKFPDSRMNSVDYLAWLLHHLSASSLTFKIEQIHYHKQN